MSGDGHGVLVAVGSDGMRDGALDLAATEALRRGTGVQVLHVVNAWVAAPMDVDRWQPIDRALTKVGREVLGDVGTRLRTRLAGRQPVSCRLVTGRVAATIDEHARAADVVVLERRDTDLVERLLTMSISTRVAAHGPAPAVVVPRHWQPPADPMPVTVGVDDPHQALGQVAAAAGHAAETGRLLVVVHAVWLAEPYQDLVLTEYSREDWLSDATEALRQSLVPLTSPSTGPQVRLDVRWGRPADVLVEASTQSSALVLTRRAPGHGLGAHLGPVTRAVLQHTECPVLVVDRG